MRRKESRTKSCGECGSLMSFLTSSLSGSASHTLLLRIIFYTFVIFFLRLVDILSILQVLIYAETSQALEACLPIVILTLQWPISSSPLPLSPPTIPHHVRERGRKDQQQT